LPSNTLKLTLLKLSPGCRGVVSKQLFYLYTLNIYPVNFLGHLAAPHHDKVFIFIIYGNRYEIEARLVDKEPDDKLPEKITFWKCRQVNCNDSQQWYKLAEALEPQIEEAMKVHGIHWNSYPVYPVGNRL
jgi:hypothetical protein